MKWDWLDHLLFWPLYGLAIMTRLLFGEQMRNKLWVWLHKQIDKI